MVSSLFLDMPGWDRFLKYISKFFKCLRKDPECRRRQLHIRTYVSARDVLGTSIRCLVKYKQLGSVVPKVNNAVHSTVIF